MKMKNPILLACVAAAILGTADPLIAAEKARGTQTYSIGLNFTDSAVTSDLTADQVAGVDTVAQANWNNLTEASSTGPVGNLVADTATGSQATTTTVEWTSPNTWASTGRGEENNGFSGSDRILMTGYLDTGNSTTTTITIRDVPSELTGPGYDVVVYSLGGVSGRGGTYRLLDANSGAVIGSQVVIRAPASPSTYIGVFGATSGVNDADFVVFKNIKVANITVEASTAIVGVGGTPRAPVNGVQLVTPSGLALASTDPLVTLRTPAATMALGAAGAPDNTPIEIQIEDGTSRKVVSGELKLDGQTVATATKTGSITTARFTPAQPFVPGSVHTATFTYLDDATPPVSTTEEWTFRVTVLTSRSLFIEGEDFNFAHGQWIQDQPIGMTGPYVGGSYQDLGDGLGGTACDGSDFGIDYNEAASNDQAIYRPGTAVEAGKRNGPAGLSRGPFDVEINHVVGWTGSGEWMNYTRRFPEPARIYKVYARTASGDSAARRASSLSVVTSDPTQCNQTVTEVGLFNAPWTGGWDTWPDIGTEMDAIIPMRDAAGADALVKLGGLTTLRYTFLPGAQDIDYLVFVPTGALGLPPKVISIKPGNNATGISNKPVLEAVIEDGEVERVVSASFQLDGNDVPGELTRNGNRTTLRHVFTGDLASGSFHTLRLSYTDNATPPETRTADVTFRVSFTPFTSETLFIEAEDFNFDHGKWITDKPIGMTGPYPGGDYLNLGNGLDGSACDGSDYGIDYNENGPGNDGAGNTTLYRPTTPVEAGKRNGPAGVNRGTFDVSVNHVIGWTGTGEWLNYTRRFPEPARLYKVFARIAHGDAAATRGGSLARVTSDPTQCDQTSEILGTFRGPWTGGWDTWPDAGTPQDALIPMKDDEGRDSLISLGGEVTLRWNWEASSGDLDYLAFMPLGADPIVTSRVPAATMGIGPAGVPDTTPIEAVIEDSVRKVVSSELKLNGQTVATGVKTGTTTTLRHNPAQPLVPGSVYTVTLNYTDDATPPVTRTEEWSFRVSVLSSRTLFVEAEDFNFGHGQWIQDQPIGVTGPYLGGSYQGLGDGLGGTSCDGTDYGIDYNDSPTNDQAVYRPTTGVEAGKLNGPAGLARGTFNVEVNHVVGWTGAGEWMNYTRRFPEPARTYRVYARIAHGDGGATRGGGLGLVTSDPTQCNQTVTELGTFRGPWTGGWDTWPDIGTDQDALIEMKDASGNAAVVNLGGLVTLRWTWQAGSGDLDYIAFAPAPAERPKITSIRRNANGTITVEWTGGGKLESATSITGPWAEVTGASSPYTFTPPAGVSVLFGRIRSP
ncbi:MAG: hypothetical protein AB1813_20260 [Verrucomicrobiota bacterium]